MERDRELDSLRINMTSNLLYDKDLNTNTNTNTYNYKCYKEKEINKTQKKNLVIDTAIDAEDYI